MNGFIGTVIIICGVIYFSIFGLHKETSLGEHTGYITAVEINGIFFKTFRAYLKTDPESSQEDSYCVVDLDVFEGLQKAAEQKQLVTVSYKSWFVSGAKHCAGEDAVIESVRSSQK